MGTLDLDAARAARTEVAGDGHVVVFGGREFTLPAELPADFAFLLEDEKVRDAMALLLGDEQWREFRALRPSLNDLLELAKGAAQLYGFESLGESVASDDSSASDGSRSRPTSSDSTD